MKKCFLALMVCLTFATSSAFAFIPSMSFFVNRTVATTRVFNYTGRPMVCSGTAFGQTFQGVVLNSWFNQVYVAPGVFADAYVYSNVYDPFARAWAEVDCEFTW